MRFLLHGPLTSAVAAALVARGEKTSTPAEVGLSPDAPPGEVLEAALKAQLEVLTCDHALADAPYAEEAAPFARSIVYLQLAGEDVEQDDAIDRLFKRYKRLTPGRLYTVTETRVKVRQLPARP